MGGRFEAQLEGAVDGNVRGEGDTERSVRVPPTDVAFVACDAHIPHPFLFSRVIPGTGQDICWKRDTFQTNRAYYLYKNMLCSC